MSEKNYYEKKIQELKNLIQSNEFEKALKEIVDELNMPYIPNIYDSEFKNLYQIVKSKLIDQDQKIKILSREEVLNMLMSSEEENQTIALDLLSEHNLRYDKHVLKNRIETWSDKENIKKAFLFEVMIDQQLDIDILFKKNLIINPAKFLSVLNAHEIKQSFEIIAQLLEKQPSLLLAANNEAKRFLLLNYPWVPNNGRNFANSIVNIINYMFDNSQKLNNEELKIYNILKEST